MLHICAEGKSSFAVEQGGWFFEVIWTTASAAQQTLGREVEKTAFGRSLHLAPHDTGLYPSRCLINYYGLLITWNQLLGIVYCNTRMAANWLQLAVLVSDMNCRNRLWI